MGDCNSSERAGTSGEDTSEQISNPYDLLSHPRRRYALFSLQRYETPTAIADLADEVVRYEMGTEPTNVPEVREQIYVALYHTHLPKLAEANIVNINLEQNLVCLGPDADELQPYLNQDGDEHGFPELSGTEHNVR